jgi:dephospho-CoA kinase
MIARCSVAPATPASGAGESQKINRESLHGTRMKAKGVPVIGLTGGIGSGKSTVARRLAELGAAVIDADRVGHEVIEPGAEAHGEIVRAFGREILDGEGRIARKKLGALVFADADKLRALNAISHPRMAERMARQIEQLRATVPPPALIVLDAAILFQAGWDRLCDRVWTVSAGDETAIARMAARDGLAPEQARARLAAQWSNAEREARAHVTIRNERSLDELIAEVDRLWREEVG